MSDVETMEDADAMTGASDFIPKEVIDEGVRQLCVKHGYVRQTRTGDSVTDESLIKSRVFDVVVEHVVSTRAEMANKRHSVTSGELYAAVFPDGPGADPKQNLAELTPLEAAVRSKLQRKVWTLTNPHRNGGIQSRLGKEGRSEVLVKTMVQRGVDELSGVFITDSGDLIMKESVAPVVEKLLSAAKELRLHDELVISPRHPELAGSMTKALDVAKKRVIAELTRTSNGSQPALPAGSVADSPRAETAE